MTNFIENLLQISITMAAVIGLLLLLVPVWQKRYSAKWRKLIWLIIAVRLLIPFSIELPSAPVQMNVDMHEIVALSSQPVYTEQNAPMSATPNKIDTPSDIVVNTTVNTTTPTVTVEKGILLDKGTVLFALWLIGLAVFTMYHIVQYRRFYGKIMASAKPLEDSEELLERAGADMGLQRYPAVLLSDNVHSPMLIGFRAPMIVLPYKLYGENELVMILRHELTHYKHHDLWYKLILLCANALHWFNPLVWLMNRQAGRDVEQVCDDYVVDGMDMEYRKAYSMTILNTMASQKGVALSTHLSKDAQNTKKRFAGILQPKTHKKGIAVLLAVMVLAVGISGCLQVGKVDEGVALYEKVAEYLPENAIHNPEMYEVQDLHEEGIDGPNNINYIWAEEPYQVTEEEFKSSGSLSGYHYYSKDEGYFLYRRTLYIAVSKETEAITYMLYANNEDKPEPVKPDEIGRNKEKREAYVQEIADKFFVDGESLKFTEGDTLTDENGNTTIGYYVCGTEADAYQYIIALDYIEGCFLALWSVDNDLLESQTNEIWRDYTIMLEGMVETVRLYQNRESGYYAMYTDNSLFHRVPQGLTVEGAFLDRYVRTVEDSAVQSYMQVGFVPNITIGEWLDAVNTNDAYAQFRPQTNPLATYLAVEWEPTGNYKVFPNNPDRQWREYITISGAYNICYLTPYRDGVMTVQLSYPFGAEYMEGLGARMHQMIDTLVLAAEGEAYAGKKQNHFKVEQLSTDTDYDGDGGLDTVQRTLDQETDLALYEVLFSNGKRLNTGVWYDNVLVPSFEGADLTGDGQNEIIFLAGYPTSTNPLAVGELAVFTNTQGDYHHMALPFVHGEGVYEQKFTVTYNKAAGQTIEVSVDGTDFRETIEIPDALWKNGYAYGSTYVNGYQQAHTVWNYKVQEQDGISRLVCSIQLFDKWSDWGLDFVLLYENGAFVVEDILICEDIYEAWM